MKSSSAVTRNLEYRKKWIFHFDNLQMAPQIKDKELSNSRNKQRTDVEELKEHRKEWHKQQISFWRLDFDNYYNVASNAVFRNLVATVLAFIFICFSFDFLFVLSSKLGHATVYFSHFTNACCISHQFHSSRFNFTKTILCCVPVYLTKFPT